MHLRTSSIQLLGFLACIAQTLSQPYARTASNLTFAGVTFPETPSVIATHQFVKQYLDAPTYNHVVRSVVFALLIQSKLLNDPSQNLIIAKADPEIITVAGLLHDMAWNPYWNPTKPFVSNDRRFEVDGAYVAREFLTNFTSTSPHGHEAGWDQRRLQLVWDTIALHGTTSIFAYKEPEVALTGYAIEIDVLGTPTVPLPGLPDKYTLTQEEYDEVYEALPELDLVDYLTGAFTGLCIVKPDTTYDNIVGGFGEDYVQGYSLKGHRFVDLLVTRGQHENNSANSAV